MTDALDWPRNRLRLTLPNDLAVLPVATAFVRAAASRYAYDESALTQWEMVTEEAAANVIQHAYAPTDRASFDLECHYQSDGMELRIHDRGIPFDPAQIAAFDPAEEQQAAGGLGWLLIHEMTDRQQYDQLGAQGKELRLFKRAPAGLALPQAPETAKPTEAEPKSAEGATFRAMRSDEAIQVVRLLYEAYRYSYINDQIYRPDYIASMNEAGKLRSYVAVLPDGAVIAHNALILHEERPAICEVGAGVASPAYRGQGVFDRLNELVLREIAAGGFMLAFAGAVTAHVASQKAARRAGWVESGLMLAAQPAEVVSTRSKPTRPASAAAFCTW
ncbi:ATP-binding protein [Methylogaea oryzae]|uniref:ATP-binding protein n=1 Tax=Methylogaea oryzae TaxID=1295382 RepID=UPI0006D04301|nr:ATP-binding protein [Methylogaea oryzae]